jgi:hypothetical protein
LNNQALIKIETTVNPGEDSEDVPKEASRRGNSYRVNTFPESWKSRRGDMIGILLPERGLLVKFHRCWELSDPPVSLASDIDIKMRKVTR